MYDILNFFPLPEGYTIERNHVSMVFKGLRRYFMNNNLHSSLTKYTHIDTVPSHKIMRFIFNARFAQCIIEQRKRLGMTQDDLAKKSGVNRTTIAKIESHQRLASTEVILKLIAALNLDIQFVERTSNN